MLGREYEIAESAGGGVSFGSGIFVSDFTSPIDSRIYNDIFSSFFESKDKTLTLQEMVRGYNLDLGINDKSDISKMYEQEFENLIRSRKYLSVNNQDYVVKKDFISPNSQQKYFLTKPSGMDEFLNVLYGFLFN